MAPDRTETDTPTQAAITVSCHCGEHSFSAAVLPSLPLRARCCHCTSCRRLTGGLYSQGTPWPGPLERIFASSLKRFAFSPRVVVLFCGTCSSPVFWVRQPGLSAEPSVGFCVGALSARDGGGGNGGGGGGGSGDSSGSGKDVVRVDDHVFVADTLDGGLLRRLGDWNGSGHGSGHGSGSVGEGVSEDWTRARCWMGEQGSQRVPDDWPGVRSTLPLSTTSTTAPTTTSTSIAKTAAAAPASTATTPAPSAQGQAPTHQAVPITCKCRGIDFILHKTDRDKLPAVTCSCRTCRAAVGVAIMPWASAALRNIGFPVGTPSGGLSCFPRTVRGLKAAVFAGDDLDARMGTLAVYESSPGFGRYYCARCSACVFHAWDDEPGHVSVAVGLLDAPDGARAERILRWSEGSRCRESQQSQVG